MALVIKAIPALHDDDALACLSAQAPQWRLELDAEGSLHVSPTFSESGPRDVEAALQLRAYAAGAGGKVFGSSAGFRLADDSVRSPDASWISADRLSGLSPEQRSKFWRTCPDIVIEIFSPTDRWDDLLAKIDMYERNGAAFVVAIDPFERRVASRGTAPHGFALNVDAIIDA